MLKRQCGECGLDFFIYPSQIRSNGAYLFCNMICKKANTAKTKRLPLNQDELKRILTYIPNTGEFFWNITPLGSRGIKAGDPVAGTLHHKGHRRIILRGKNYSLHRLAWLYVYGHWPEKLIDHKNRCKIDNRIDNLRESTIGQNGANSKTRSSVGLKGVTLAGGSKKNPYHASISINGKTKHIGLFPTAEAAHAAYCEIGKVIFGEYFCAG